MFRRGPDGSNNVRMLAVVLALGLAGCISESDELDPVNDQGERVSDETSSLNGFWDGGLNQTEDLRVLVYNGNVYARNTSDGFYGSVLVNDDLRRVSMDLGALGLNAASSDADAQWVADGVDNLYALDLQIYTLTVTNDAMQGTAEINGGDTSLVLLQRDGTWDEDAPLNKLVKSGTWLSGSYQMVTSSATGGVSFQVNSTTSPTCSFNGLLKQLDVRFNLYAVDMSARNSCPAFNDESASGYAGFNTDGDLEFYLRSNDTSSLLFFTFTPPVGATPPADNEESVDDTAPPAEDSVPETGV